MSKEVIKSLKEFGELFLWIIFAICACIFLIAIISRMGTKEKGWHCGWNKNIFINCNDDEKIDRLQQNIN